MFSFLTIFSKLSKLSFIFILSIFSLCLCPGRQHLLLAARPCSIASRCVSEVPGSAKDLFCYASIFFKRTQWGEDLNGFGDTKSSESNLLLLGICRGGRRSNASENNIHMLSTISGDSDMDL